MRGLGILILAVLFFWVFWPLIARWLKRKAMERAEDYMRSRMGMPPREKKKKKDDSASRDYYSQSSRKDQYGYTRHVKEPLIPKEYAEDVEFTESHDYSARGEYHEDAAKNGKIYHESQVSDVEYVEIKESRTK